MASAKITLMGMYNYNEHLFDDLVLPENIDKDDFIASLLIEAGEFEVLYPDYDFLKTSIKLWGIKWNRTFSEWYRGTQSTWNPIENYDKYETSKDVLKHQRNLQDKTTYGSNSTDEQITDATNEHKVAAYDSNDYAPKEKSIINAGKAKNTRGGNDTLDHTGNSKDVTKRESHIHGNIGVTQASDMLKSFYDISSWNLINHMVDVFKSELLICIY